MIHSRNRCLGCGFRDTSMWYPNHPKCVKCKSSWDSKLSPSKKISVLPHTFEQGGREELFLIFPSKEDAEMVKEVLENKIIKLMWIEPQNSFGSHALRIEVSDE